MSGLRTGVASLAAVLLIALSGCSAPEAQSADPADSPLNAYMAAFWGGDLSEEEQMERFEKENLEREELVAQCMTDQGFEYIPVTNNGSVFFDAGQEWKPDDREWVAQYGYGMVRYPGYDEPFVDDGSSYEDPNQEYVTSLSESEQMAYYEALYGPSPTEEELADDGSYEWNWETAGCHGWASHEMEGENPLTSDEHKPLMDALNEFWMSMENNTAFAELDSEWAACMADAGQPGFSAQRDASTSISDELNAYYESQTEWVEKDPKLDEIAEKEIALALVDLDCREKTNFAKERAAISAKLEEQFIADHKAELEALKAAVEQGR